MPSKCKCGMSIHFEDIPGKSKNNILKDGIIKVVKYRTIAEAIHLKNPNVIRFIGNRRILITGLAINETNVIAIPAKISVDILFSSIIP